MAAHPHLPVMLLQNRKDSDTATPEAAANPNIVTLALRGARIARSATGSASTAAVTTSRLCLSIIAASMR